MCKASCVCVLVMSLWAATATATPATSPELVPFAGTRTLTATWGAPSGGYHAYPAIDIGMPTGTPVYAAGAGTIVASHSGCPVGNLESTCGINNLGNMIQIAHPDGRHSRYGHLSSLVVASGNVAAGQLIGYSGSSGKSTGPHLHYQETNGSSYTAAVDPGTWVACHGAARVDYVNLQTLVHQAVRNDGYGCAAGPVGDGGLVRTPNGNVYRIVGGAPLHMSRCDYTDGCAGVVNIPDLSQYAAYPRDGALVGNVDDGGVYRFAGGAPLWISSCAYAPGCGGIVPIDAHPFSVNDHMRPYPADGTLVANQRDGGIYRFAGGAPQWISSCEYAPGCNRSVVPLDGGTFDRQGSISGEPHMRPYPADGTYLTVAGALYRVAGGAPLALTDCSLLDGRCQPAVALDQGTLARRGAISGQPRLRELPADGTVLRGVPSATRWSVVGGVAAAFAGSTQGVTVNDATIARLRPSPAPEPSPAIPLSPAEAPPTIASPAPVTGPPARIRSKARTLRLRLKLGSIPRRARLAFSGTGVRTRRWTRLGHGRYRVVVRVAKGSRIELRDVRVKLGGRTIRVVRNAARV